MRFTTRLTLLFGLVLLAFVVSTLPVTAGLFRGAMGSPVQSSSDWDKVATLWSSLDEDTKAKTAELMAAVTEWKAASAVPSLEGDARYLRFQTAFLTFAAFQALVLLALVIGGLRVLMAPVRSMAQVVDRLKAGDTAARLSDRGGAEWRALARQFNTMLDQNQTLNRLQGWQEVASFLSHQIKNPLTSISFAEQNVRNLVVDLPPLAAENLAIIGDQARRINNLLRRLRDLTSFEQLARVTVELEPWVRDWQASRRREAEVWTLSFSSVGTVSLVPLLWEQALDNLLANSREAWTGPEPLGLDLEVCGTGNWIEFTWTDTNQIGEGTSLAQIGTARYTTKKEGSGLGVFFVRRIAELHGGGLTILPSPRGGLRFVLTLEGGGHGPNPRRR